MLSPADFDMLFRQSDTKRPARRSRLQSLRRKETLAVPLSLPVKTIKRR
jgi:hypothetical protein